MKEKDVFKMGKFYLRKNHKGQWDFYRDYGVDGNIKRCTYEDFNMVIVEGSLVKVYKQVADNGFAWGLYNSEAEVILPIEWGEIVIITSNITNKPAYLLLRDLIGFWGVGNIDGTIILSPVDFAEVKSKIEDKKEYVDLLDKTGKEIKYEITNNGLKIVS